MSPQMVHMTSALNWLKGASKVTVDSASKVTKVAVDSSVNFAQSEETQKVLKEVGSSLSDVGGKVGGWVNNVAARATGGKVKVGTSFPPASWWTGDAPAAEEKEEVAEEGGDKQNGEATNPAGVLLNKTTAGVAEPKNNGKKKKKNGEAVREGSA